MKKVSFAGLAAAAFIAAQAQLTGGETARFKHLVSVYFDAKGAGLNLPEAVACDAAGQLVIGDTGNDRVLRFTYRDKALSGGSEIKIPQVSAPSRIHLNSKGQIFVLDGRQRRIAQLSSEGEFKEVVAPSGIPAPATVIPKDFAIDAADNIYVLDAFSARVLVLDSQAQFQKALALPPETGFGSSLAVDFAGNILVLDGIKRRIFSAAKDAKEFSALGGDLAEFVPTLPTYITAARGVIFVVEGIGSSIAGFGRDGAFLARTLTMGWNEGMLNHPSQICINDKDEVFIADRDNSRVQVFQLIR